MQNKSDSAKSDILFKIRQAKTKKDDFRQIEPDSKKNIYKEIEPSLELCFAKELETVNGFPILCNTENDVFEALKNMLKEKNVTQVFCKDKELIVMLEKYQIPFSSSKDDFFAMQAALTSCEVLVARTGSVLVSSASDSGRQLHAFPPIHIIYAKKSQLRPYLSDAIAFMKKKYGENLPSVITNITGPSRTADIEKTLILGAHGPKECWVYLNLSE